jgi:hypothetical protein
MAEVGVATAIGVRAPAVAWCSDAYHTFEVELASRFLGWKPAC